MITKNTELKEILAISKDCKTCGHCCSFTSGALVEENFQAIADHLKLTKEEFKKKYLEEIEKFDTTRFRPKLIREKGNPYGKCIFLQDKKCSINKVKPLECRTANCNEHGEDLSLWFMLNYYVDKDNPESIRQFEIFLRNNRTLEGGSLKDFIKDKEKLKKILSFDKLK